MKYGQFAGAVLLVGAAVLSTGALAQGASPGGTLVGASSSDDSPTQRKLEQEIQRINASKPKEAATIPRLDKIKLAVKAAQGMIPEKKYLEALAKLSEFDSLTDKTPEETYLIERTRISIFSLLGDDAQLLKALEAAMGTTFTPPAERVDFADALTRKNFNQKNYAKTIVWSTRYFSEGGKDTAIRRAQILSYYLSGDYARARQEIGADIQTAEASGQVPAEEQLRLLVSCAQKLDDKVALTAASEKYARYYPKKP